MATLIDASYLVALAYPRDKNHEAAKAWAAQHNPSPLIPDVVLVEAIYNIQRLGGTFAAIHFARYLLQRSPRFVPLEINDVTRAVDLMETYRDADLDFVDCCLTALAERLYINRICTFDRRDFSMIRPRHTDYLELVP